jgi:hypothetical protein
MELMHSRSTLKTTKKRKYSICLHLFLGFECWSILIPWSTLIPRWDIILPGLALHMYKHIFIYVHIHIYIYAYIYIQMYTYIHIYTYIYMYIHIDIYAYICIYIYVYIYKATTKSLAIEWILLDVINETNPDPDLSVSYT